MHLKAAGIASAKCAMRRAIGGEGLLREEREIAPICFLEVAKNEMLDLQMEEQEWQRIRNQTLGIAS